MVKRKFTLNYKLQKNQNSKSKLKTKTNNLSSMHFFGAVLLLHYLAYFDVLSWRRFASAFGF